MRGIKGTITNVIDESKVREIFELREKGFSRRGIAKMLNANRDTVVKYLNMGLEDSVAYIREIKKGRTELPKIKNEEILEDETAKDWLDSLAEGTSKGYLSGIGYFCAFVKKGPTELIEEARGEVKAGKLLSERGYFRYLNRFEKMLKKRNFAPNTIHSYVATVRSFYGFYQDFDMPKQTGKNRGRKVKPLVENVQNKMTKEDISNMLSVAKNLRDKAIILSITSSGLGASEIVALTIRQFYEGYEEETGLCVLALRRKKTDVDFISIFSTEATDMIWTYLDLEREITKDNIKKHLNEALFAVTKDTEKGGTALKAPLSVGSLGRIFRDIGKRLDMSPTMTKNGNTVFSRVHAHNVRKIFNTEMKNAGMPEIMVEFLMGHELVGVKDTYYQERIDELKKSYLKCMPSITIQPTETYVLESEEYKELKSENALLKDRLEALETKEKEREPYDEKMTKVLERLVSNLVVKDLIKKELEELKKEEG